MAMHVQIIVFTIYILAVLFIAGQETGPYEIVLETVKDCVNKGTGEISVISTAATKEDGKVYHSGELQLPTGWKDNLKSVGDASIWENERWNPIGLVWKLTFNKACTGMKNGMADLWFDILKAANVEPLECPIPEGTYHFVDYHINNINTLKTLKYGKYRVRLHVYKKSKKLGCLCYIANVIKA